MYGFYIKKFCATSNYVVTRDFVLCLFTDFMSVFQMRNFNDGSAQRANDVPLQFHSILWFISVLQFVKDILNLISILWTVYPHIQHGAMYFNEKHPQCFPLSH